MTFQPELPRLPRRSWSGFPGLLILGQIKPRANSTRPPRALLGDAMFKDEMPKSSPSGEQATSEAPAAHSIVEERLYLLTIRCGCGGGPFQKVSQTLARQG